MQNQGYVWMQGVNIYFKVNVLPLPFALNNIFSLGVWIDG
jgi:hypothetical protein